jgi:hypothetical protein
MGEFKVHIPVWDNNLGENEFLQKGKQILLH